MKVAFVLSAVLILIDNCASISQTDEIIKGNHQFTADLYRRLVKGRQDKNFVFSPLTISIALGLARIGATGKSADEITKAVGLPKDNNEFLKSLEKIKNILNSDSYKLSQAVGFYTGKDVKVRNSFKAMLNQCPDAKLESVNFKDVPAAIEKINRWVQVQTRHKIKDLLTENDINETTQLLLIEAVYFSATWRYPFRKLSTKKRFRISRTRTKFVDMMTVTDHFKYYVLDNVDATAIELPYKGKDASMVIVLPNKNLGDLTAINRNFAEVIKITTAECKNQCSMRYLNVEMPLFTVWARYPMLRDLNELGIKTAFSKDADFNNMVDGTIKIQNVVHKAFINVTTEGTVAAGAPADNFQFRSLQNIHLLETKPSHFKVHHGFVYYIKISNTVIMVGKTSHTDGIHL